LTPLLFKPSGAPKRKLKEKAGKFDCTTEESVRILKAFSVDGGGYRDMVKELGFELIKIRKHLTMHFIRAIDIITNKVR
jgi:transposase